MTFIEDFSYIEELIKKGLKNAVIDVDNTITKSNIAQFYLFVMRERIQSRGLWGLFLLYCVLAAPFYLTIDFLSRDLFNRVFVLRKFKSYSKDQLEQYAAAFFEKKLKHTFIRFTHDLIFYLKKQGVHVVLLSTNFDLIVKQYGAYFDVPYVCLQVQQKGSGITIDFSKLKGFKESEIRKFNPSDTLAIGDSKYDFPALDYVDYPLIVADKQKSWMTKLRKSPAFIPCQIKSKTEV